MMIDGGTVAGNAFDKYHAANPISRWMVGRFMRTVRELALRTGAKTALEVGCGEGEVARCVSAAGIHVHATDVSPRIIEVASAHPSRQDIQYSALGIADLDPALHAAPLVLAIEVLEHVNDPEAALRKLASLARPWVLMSVPREPLWRILNVARGKYLTHLGNTPGHVNHWSRAAVCRMAESVLDIEVVRAPIPWTIVLGRAR